MATASSWQEQGCPHGSAWLGPNQNPAPLSTTSEPVPPNLVLLLAPPPTGLNQPCTQVGWEAEEGVHSPRMDRETLKPQLPCLSRVTRSGSCLELVFVPFASISTSCDCQLPRALLRLFLPAFADCPRALTAPGFPFPLAMGNSRLLFRLTLQPGRLRLFKIAVWCQPQGWSQQPSRAPQAL